MDVRSIQQALKDQGFDTGLIDGIWGRQSIAALRAFQSARGLTVDGIAGPQTIRALDAKAAASVGAVARDHAAPVVWYDQALGLIGTREKPGPASNPEILRWAKNCNIDYKSDDIPWCGLFVAHCIASTLPEERLPSAPLAARSWRRFGAPSEAVRGAVLVFWRRSRSGPFGHVGFYRSEDKDAYHVVGGNQSDMVNVCRIGKDRLLEARWPTTAAALRGEKVTARGSGALSHDEA
jgi:uncharacterized protein (TIGR02594 family)